MNWRRSGSESECVVPLLQLKMGRVHLVLHFAVAELEFFRTNLLE